MEGCLAGVIEAFRGLDVLVANAVRWPIEPQASPDWLDDASPSIPRLVGVSGGRRGDSRALVYRLGTRQTHA